ncbi:MAG: FG-GAP-like repeat-containing protein [Polyangiales bacterium]
MRPGAGFLAALAVLLASACSKEDDGTGGEVPDSDSGVPSEGGTPGDRDAGRDGSRPGPGTDAGDGEVDAGGGEDDGGGPMATCQPACGVGQRCEQSGTGLACRDVACSELTCDGLTECAPAPGGGNQCASIACASDVACPDGRFCDGTKCIDDVCESETARCDGNTVKQCTSNGGAEQTRFACAGSAYFTSACSDDGPSGPGCGCQDDWDCPNHTVCNAGTCQGTGVAPTCTLPPVPFDQVLPSLEFRWGGASVAMNTAVGSPFPTHAQVSMTPVVANLDDDNGDGRINELDFPEIVFTSYRAQTTNIHFNGVVRAVHAGGTKRGKDYFARCGAKYWLEGGDLAPATCGDDEGVARPGGGVAVGDLDRDGSPEIVAATENGTVQILDNKGALIVESAKAFPSHADGSAFRYPQVAIADLDNAGLVEIIVGNRVLTLQKPTGMPLAIRDVFTGQATAGAQGEFGPMVCVANVIDASPTDADVTQEIVAGTTLYRLPAPPTGVTSRAGCVMGDASDFCLGRLTTLWNARTVNGMPAIPDPEGFCAIADVLAADPAAAPGPSAPLDRVPEVVVVANGRVLIFKASDGTLLRTIDVEVGQRGGAPNIDDFDGDGFPEIAMASSGFYTVIDLQATEPTSCAAWNTALAKNDTMPNPNPARNPGAACTTTADCNPGAVCGSAGQCVCLHNGWKRTTEDDSSRATSSSVFDFNGDGSAEVVYGDECYFRVYDGKSGKVQLAIPSLSRTVLENPVVADVDNDGNAEIVFVNNNETVQCNEPSLVNPDNTTVAKTSLPTGIQVWGDKSDTWVSARRIWNQHAYHVTNVTESGHVPVKEPESWRPYGNRLYNTYRSQPRSFGVAPDLTLTAIQLSSPDAACGELSDQLDIVVQVKNIGDLRVGPGVEIAYFGVFAGQPLTPLNGTNGSLKSTLTTSLEPGSSVLVKASYQVPAGAQTVLPTRIEARVDAAQAERECLETNNTISADVSEGEQLADLSVAVLGNGGNCNAPTVSVRVTNDGSLAASDVLVRLYAGDPSAGGQPIGEITLPGPIAPGAFVDTTIGSDALDRNIRVWVVADPLGSIEECNNVNNIAMGPELSCGVVVI